MFSAFVAGFCGELSQKPCCSRYLTPSQVVYAIGQVQSSSRAPLVNLPLVMYIVSPFWLFIVYTVIPFSEHWSCGMKFQKLFFSCCSARIIWSSHPGLYGSESHELIALNIIGGRVMIHIVNNHAVSISLVVPPFSSPYSVLFTPLLRWFSLFNLSVLLVLSLQDWNGHRVMRKYCIVRAQIGNIHAP